jgi:hypothetical protein
MTIPRWLDRIWLTMIALSFVFFVPLWLIVQYERATTYFGAEVVNRSLLAGAAGAAFCYWRHWHRNRYSINSSTARENASNPSSSPAEPAARDQEAGSIGPR